MWPCVQPPLRIDGEFHASTMADSVIQPVLANTFREDAGHESQAVCSLFRPPVRIREDHMGADFAIDENLLEPPCYIKQLAPEILGMTFLHVMDPMASPHEELLVWPSATLKSMRALKILRRVCRSWREVCLSMPAACDTIHDCRGSNVELSILRATIDRGVIPLNIFINRHLPSPAMIELFQSYGSRVRNLYLCFPTDRSFAFRVTPRPARGERGVEPLEPQHVKLSTNFQAPALEHLTVDSSSTDSRPFYPTLFQGHAPQLKTLALRSSMWLPANRFPSLTHLYVSLSSKRTNHSLLPRGSAWTVPKLLSFMSGCPSLEDVSLWNVYTQLSAATDAPAVDLPHLRRLAIGRSHPASATWLLQHIVPPADSVAVRILDCFSSTSQLKELLSALPLLDSRTAHLRKTPVGLAVSLVGVSSATSVEIALPADSHPPELGTGHGPPPTVWASWPGLSGVRELYLVGMDSLLEEPFAGVSALLEQLPELATLVYCGTALPRAFLEYLSPTSRGLPCPGLETVHLCVPGVIAVDVKKLNGLSDARARTGHGLRRIIVETDVLISDGVRACEGVVELRGQGTPSSSVSWPAVCTKTTHGFWPPW